MDENYGLSRASLPFCSMLAELGAPLNAWARWPRRPCEARRRGPVQTMGWASSSLLAQPANGGRGLETTTHSRKQGA